MTPQEKNRIRDLPIESVAERLSLKVNRHKALCPFHDDHSPSLSFSAARNTFKCFVCGARGDTISLAMQVLHKPFPEACQWLADEHNVIITKYQPTQKKSDMKPTVIFDREICEHILANSRYGCYPSEFLFNQRRLNPQVIRQLRIGCINDSGYSLINWLKRHFPEDRLRKAGLLVGNNQFKRCYLNAPCLLFPYYNLDGELIGIQSRYIGNLIRYLTPETQARHEEQIKHIPRFQFLRGSHPSIFNLPVLRTLQPGDELWITEGVTDCLAMLSSGRKAIAIPSATLLTYSNKQLLTSTIAHLSVTLHIYPDQDEAGERLYNELLQFSLSAGLTLVRHTLPEGIKDYAELYASLNPQP